MRERGAGGRRLRRRDRPWSQRAACTTTLVVVERARVAATRPRSSSARPLGPLACREDDARRRARPRPTRAAPLGARAREGHASGDLLRVRRGAGPPDRDPMAMPLRRYRDRQYMLLSSFSLTRKSCSGCSLARQHGAWVSLGLGRPVVSRPGPRPRCVCVPLYALDGLSHVGSPDL